MIESEVLKDFQKMSKMLQQKDQQIAELKQKLHTQSREVVEQIYKGLLQEKNWRAMKDAWNMFGESKELWELLNNILKEHEEK